MDNEILDEEWELAESAAKVIQDKINTHYTESVRSSSGVHVKAEVLVPMTENINMAFKIDVPYELMDEDQDVLLEYFQNNICPSDDKEYITIKKLRTVGVVKG